MNVREGVPQRWDTAVCLVGVVLSLLFVGFVKGIVKWPVDLTFVALCILLILLAKSSSKILLSLQSSPKTGALLFLLCFYFLLRFLPAASEVGLLKLGHLFVFGLPLFFAGILIGQSPRSMRSLVEVLIVLGTCCGRKLFLQSVSYGQGKRQGPLWIRRLPIGSDSDRSRNDRCCHSKQIPFSSPSVLCGIGIVRQRRWKRIFIGNLLTAMAVPTGTCVADSLVRCWHLA